ncbi:MAG TPA: hypothetical protein PKA41_13885 [Verrucomicrobiota bacterium]|nr:hypothetical protein [Verrucomicrobiota bacterium]
MVEIKVQCSCGQKYKFDVEPVNGQMPYTIACPICGADGTAAANGVIQSTLASATAAVAPPGVGAPPIPPPVQPGRLRISTSHASVPPPPPPVSAAAAGGFQAPASKPVVQRAAPPKKPVSDEKMFLMGAIGAVVGGFLGMMGWFWLIKVTGYEIGFAAWGVGLLVGVGARVLAKQGSTMLGIVAGACALVAIVGGQYLAAKSAVDEELAKWADEAYDERMKYAQTAAKAETNEDIRAFLAKDYEVAASEISDEQVRDFRENELPELKDLASGKTTKEEFNKDFNEIKDSFVYKILLLKESVGLFTLLWLFLGVGSAYKIGSGGED